MLENALPYQVSCPRPTPERTLTSTSTRPRPSTLISRPTRSRPVARRSRCTAMCWLRSSSPSGDATQRGSVSMQVARCAAEWASVSSLSGPLGKPLSGHDGPPSCTVRKPRPVDTSSERQPPRGDVRRAVSQTRPPSHPGPGGQTATSIKEPDQPVHPSRVKSPLCAKPHTCAQGREQATSRDAVSSIEVRAAGAGSRGRPGRLIPLPPLAAAPALLAALPAAPSRGLTRPRRTRPRS